MKNIFFIAWLIYVSLSTQAQNIDRQIVSGSGGYVITGTAQLSFTLGEMAIHYLSTSGLNLSQGFQQTNNSNASISTSSDINVQVSTYPNPFIGFIEVKCDQILDDATFHIVDAGGKKIQVSPKEIETGKQWHIEMGELPAGNYWMTIGSGDKQSSFSLIHITN